MTRVSIDVPNAGGQRGAFIVFEGPDGSGKSTLSKAVTQKLIDLGQSIHWQCFPSKEGEVGKLIRQTFTGEIELTQEVLGYLMVADGLDVMDRMYEKLQGGDTVILDRYCLVSGWAYQTEVFTFDELLAIQQRQRFLEPDVTFILDVKPEVAKARIAARSGDANLVFEKDDDDYRDRLRDRYVGYSMCHPNTVLLDGTKEVDVLVSEVISIILNNFTTKLDAIPLPPPPNKVMS